MASKSVDREKKKNDFIKMLISVDRDQLAEFINTKGKEPKLVKPFICLYTQ